MHKGTSYPGEHEAIIDRATWDKVHAILAENTVARANGTRAQTPALLRGLIFAPGGHAMTPSHTRKDGKLYRYYVATDAIRQGYSECPVRSVPSRAIASAGGGIGASAGSPALSRSRSRAASSLNRPSQCAGAPAFSNTVWSRVVTTRPMPGPSRVNPRRARAARHRPARPGRRGRR